MVQIVEQYSLNFRVLVLHKYSIITEFTDVLAHNGTRPSTVPTINLDMFSYKILIIFLPR